MSSCAWRRKPMQLRSHRGSSVCIKAGLEQILHRLRWWIELQVLHRRLVALYLITYLITVADKTLCLQTYKRSAWYAGLGPYTKLPFAPNKRQIVNMLRNLDDRLSCKTRIKCYAQVKHYSWGLPPPGTSGNLEQCRKVVLSSPPATRLARPFHSR